MHSLTPINTDRLCLRMAEERDLEFLFDMFSRDEVTHYLPYDTWQTMADAQAWWQRTCERHQRNEARQLVLQEKNKDTVVGSVIIFGFTKEQSAELGYSLNSSYWGQGLMHEAIESFIQACRTQLDLHALTAKVEKPNRASSNLLTRLGFIETDRSFENSDKHGQIELLHFQKNLL